MVVVPKLYLWLLLYKFCPKIVQNSPENYQKMLCTKFLRKMSPHM